MSSGSSTAVTLASFAAFLPGSTGFSLNKSMAVIMMAAITTRQIVITNSGFFDLADREDCTAEDSAEAASGSLSISKVSVEISNSFAKATILSSDG